jgi:hypothetical protein
MPTAFAHSPWFVMRHAREMLEHTFTGTSWRSMLGLDSERTVFERYRASRRLDRERLWAEAY